MKYVSRIQADPTYLQALGQALYNFTYLEWVVIWTIVKLKSDGFASVPKGQTAAKIAQALKKAIDETSPPLPKILRQQLIKFSEAYRSAIFERNKLLHAHPFTASDGSQQLGGGGRYWPMAEVNKASKLFEDAAIFGNAIFHGQLKEARPETAG